MSHGEALARERFSIPQGVIYLDGNSLGAMPKATPERLRALMREEWRTDLIASWTKHGWIDLPMTVAAKLAPVLGAKASELLVVDSTSVSLFKLLGAAVRARPGRTTILTQRHNFPTDLYVAQGLADMLGMTVKTVAADEIAEAIDESVAVVTLTHVDYRSGAVHDMAAVNQVARAAGALTCWDLSHSGGALALDLNGSDCDLAVGCGYKYLNGGPGAPAYIFIADALQDQLSPPLQGWMGHLDPFAFADDYAPARGIARFLTGTPSILALAAMECGIATFDGIAMTAIEARSRELTQGFIERVEDLCGGQVTLASPRDPARRGSHVSFAHPNGYAVMQALIERQVIGDFRAPDLLRFGFAPLYNDEAEVIRAADILGDIIRTGDWDSPRFHARGRVT
ncbi:MAG: kynureninase [Pseudomonadota bacterium]|nr:kynureninase [Pseudomonadota bacterium]